MKDHPAKRPRIHNEPNLTTIPRTRKPDPAPQTREAFFAVRVVPGAQYLLASQWRKLMEVSTSTPGSAARRNEDIALDLLKFVATTAGVGRKESGATTGFVAASTPKPDDQVTHLLELYGRCLAAVQGKGAAR